MMAALTLPGSTLAASVNNGSLEGSAPIGSYLTLPTDSTAIEGWTVSAGAVDWIGTFWSSFHGTKSVDMNAVAPGALSQQLTTAVNNTYVVGFSLAGNPTCAPATKTLAVSATGGTTSPYSFSIAGKTQAAMGWTSQSYSFTATSVSTALTFTSTTPGTCGPALDLVTLTETVATTAADCKKNGWRSMVDSAGSKFKNQGDCVSFYATGGRNLGAGAP